MSGRFCGRPGSLGSLKSKEREKEHEWRETVISQASSFRAARLTCECRGMARLSAVLRRSDLRISAPHSSFCSLRAGSYSRSFILKNQ